MCEICNNTEIHVHVKEYDPTHTMTLRNAFVTDMNRRFKQISRAITKAVATEDVFGLNQPTTITTNVTTPGNAAFAFASKSSKIQAFLDWLRQVEDAVLLEMRTDVRFGLFSPSPWFGVYLAQAYEQGSKRAQQEIKNAGLTTVLQDATTGMAYINPVSVDKLLVLFTRAFTDLQGVTASMDAQISKILADGLFEGQSPITLARLINSAIIDSGETLGMDISYVNSKGKSVTYFMSGRRRAEILARTEIIRAHHKAMIEEYRTWAVEGVYVLAEWATAGDARVCPLCEGLQGTIWTLDEIENKIPAHPQCRCISIPFVDTTKTKQGGQ